MTQRAGIGIMVEGQEGLTWEKWRHLCKVSDSLRFDSLWRSDHYYSVLDVPGRETIETWTSLALAAEWTSRVEFGPLVSSMTFRQPELTARMAASVDQLSGGRLVLGLGAGWYEKEHRLFNVPFPSVRDRMDRFEEGVRRVRETWEKGPPRPPRGTVPILVGGAGARRTLPLVAREADEWNCHGFSPEEYAEKVRILERCCAEIGRDPSEIRRSYMTSYLVGSDQPDLSARAKRLASFIPRLDGLTPEQVVEDCRSRGWFVGSGAEVVEGMRRYVDLGISRFMLQHYLLDDDAALEVLANEVIPQL